MLLPLPSAAPGSGRRGGAHYTAPLVAEHGTGPGTPPGVVVEEARSASDELLAAFHRLIPQLSSSAPPLTPTQLAAIVASPATTVLVARADGVVVGALTLVVFRVPTGVRAWIEDVVVDEDHRGGGIGAALVHVAVARATAAGARNVDLTSRPARTAANRLYRRLGFEQRDTNVYRLTLEHAERADTGAVAPEPS